MSALIKMIKNKKGKIEIKYDEDCISPRDCSYYENNSTMVCGHRKYSLGDVQIGNYKNVFTWMEAFELYLKERKLSCEEVLCLPLYLYDHGQISINTIGYSCNWDSCQIGFIYKVKDFIKKEFKINTITKKMEERVLLGLNNEVKKYNQFLNNEVYSYIVYNKDNEIIDQCCGYYDCKTCIDDAKKILLEK